MGNRGRRRGTRAGAAYQSDPTRCSKKQEPTPQSESDESPGPEDRSPEIVSIRWKKPRGAAVIQYADGSRYEGGVDDEERKHGTGVHILKSGHIFEGGWVHGDFEGCEHRRRWSEWTSGPNISTNNLGLCVGVGQLRHADLCRDRRLPRRHVPQEPPPWNRDVSVG